MRPISSLTAAARRDRRHPRPLAAGSRCPRATTRSPSSRGRWTQMLRELDAARSETQQMIQAQRDFVADASHELRTPLTSILANLELLEASLAERGADPDEEEIVAGALGSSRRMRRLVADLLLLARADAGRAGPRRSCDLREIAAAAVSEVRPGRRRTRARARDLIRGDRRGQPRRPAPAGRSTWSRTASTTRPTGTTVTVSVSSRADEAVIEVTDDGPGLPEGRRRADLLPLRARQRARRSQQRRRHRARAGDRQGGRRRRTAAGSSSGARPPAGPGSPFCCRSAEPAQKLSPIL